MNKDIKVLDLPQMSFGETRNKEEYRVYLISKGIGEEAADILTADASPNIFEQIENAERESHKEDIKCNDLLQLPFFSYVDSETQNFLVERCGPEAAQIILKNCPAERANQLALSLRSITLNSEALELPKMDWR